MLNFTFYPEIETDRRSVETSFFFNVNFLLNPFRKTNVFGKLKLQVKLEGFKAVSSFQQHLRATVISLLSMT